MYLCCDCKERERSWNWSASQGHCDNKRCENYLCEPTHQLTICECLSITTASIVGTKNYKNLTQSKLTKYFKKE